MINGPSFIETKRDGREHSEADLEAFVSAVAEGALPDYQLSAWLMAVFFHGLSQRELAAFTSALANSGEIAALPSQPGLRAVDKHSTGGVGDKTTLIVVPIVAACGAHVAKLSGRGLGFTGGTVDKLESIPGMDLHLSPERFIRQVGEIGAAISGHSKKLAPAEGIFYALRDVTATVPSLPLIASSIVSKKIAGGADAFVFDVKCGSGAFSPTEEKALALGQALVDLSASLGKKAVGIISDMDQPLGEWVGNAAEVAEAVAVLSGAGPKDTRTLSLALAAEMLYSSGLKPSLEAAAAAAERALDDGDALARFAAIIRAQGGDDRICADPNLLASAEKRQIIRAPRSGFVTRMDAGDAGMAVRALGGGRIRKEDDIDKAVALRFVNKVGAAVSEGDTLIEVFYNREEQLTAALPYLESCCEVGEAAAPRQLILGRVEGGSEARS